MFYILTAIELFACNSPKIKKTVQFTRPLVKQYPTKDTVHYLTPKYIHEGFPIFAGKHKFADTLHLQFSVPRNTSDTSDFFYISNVNWNLQDKIRTDGFELIPDYATNIPIRKYADEFLYYYYPLYIVNQTPSIKNFLGKDSYVFAIQEALDSNNRWRPIEAAGHDWCGMGKWAYKVNPKEYIAVLFPKYFGDFKTKIRIRLMIGENTYISVPFEGKINSKQFYIEKNGYLYSHLKGNRESARYYFYGTTPLEMENENWGK